MNIMEEIQNNNKIKQVHIRMTPDDVELMDMMLNERGYPKKGGRSKYIRNLVKADYQAHKLGK